MTVLFMGVFMSALDSAVVGPAMPALRAAFGVDISQVGMVTIVFSLCSLSSNALMASLSDRYGRRPIYLLNILGFAVGSLVIAVAPTFAVVLAGRALQGFSAGGITPTASAMVGDAFPPEKRGKMLGLIGATFGMAFLVGPLFASIMLTLAGWPWIFLINLPLAAVIFWMGLKALPTHAAAGVGQPFDWAGVVLVASMLTLLMLGINRVADRLMDAVLWPWLLAGSAVCLVVLLLVERRAVRPIVPLRVFASRQLAVTYALTLGAGYGMGSVIYVASFAVAAFDMAAKQAGFLLIPLVLASSAGSVLFGRWLNKLGPRAVLLSGFGALGLGSGLLGVSAVGLWLFIVATVFMGLGVGIVVGGTLRTIVLDEVPVADRGAAQGLVNIGISVGSLLVVATLGALADMLGGGVAGLSQAYLACAGVMGAMALLVLGLRGK